MVPRRVGAIESEVLTTFSPLALPVHQAAFSRKKFEEELCKKSAKFSGYIAADKESKNNTVKVKAMVKTSLTEFFSSKIRWAFSRQYIYRKNMVVLSRR